MVQLSFLILSEATSIIENAAILGADTGSNNKKVKYFSKDNNATK